MKAIQTFLIFSFLLLSITNVSAQYGGNGYGSNGYNGSGRMNNGINQPDEPSKPKEIPVEVTAAKIMEEMKPALNLDELQAIAITNVLKESLREKGVLLKQEYSQEDQIKNFKALAETTDQKINQFLNKEQKEKYIIYKEQGQNRKKTKENSKSKSKDKTEKKE